MRSCITPTWLVPVSILTSTVNVSPTFLVVVEGERDNVEAGAARFLISWFCPTKKTVAGIARMISPIKTNRSTFFIRTAIITGNDGLDKR